MTLALPCGITGFGDYRDPPPSHSTDASRFKATVYESARRCRLGVTAFTKTEGMRSFHVAALKSDAESIYVLCNRHFRWIAFAQNLPRHESDFVFSDETTLAEELVNDGYFIVILRHQLEAPLSDDSLVRLSPAETNQIRYHRPKRLGEIIFNTWD